MTTPEDEPDCTIIQDYIVLGISQDVHLPNAREMLDDMASRATIGQYDNPPKAILLLGIEWLLTSDWQEVERFQPAHDCVTCRAGNDQAIAFLKEHPEKRLALGNISYIEVW